MVSKLVILFMAVAAATALPAYSTSSSSSGGVNYQSVQSVVPSHQVTTSYVQPQVAHVQTSSSNYVQPQVTHVQTSSIGHGQTSYVQPQVNYVQSSGSVGQSVFISAADVGVPYVHESGNQVQETGLQEHGAPIITKNFYTFSGPEEHDENTIIHHINIGRPQKHHRVIFIKNPSSSANRALIKAHVAPNEEKTVVYVLSKHQNELNVESEIDEPAPTQPSKPEIVFVKYRTPEEIRHLQETVQTQYNAIDGVNQVSDEGFAPVRSVIGALGGEGSDGSSVYSTGTNGVYATGSENAGSYTTGGSGYTTGGSGSYSTGGSGTYTTGGTGSYTTGGTRTYTTGGLVTGTLGAEGLHYF